jgi:hypothetical protein
VIMKGDETLCTHRYFGTICFLLLQEINQAKKKKNDIKRIVYEDVILIQLSEFW